MSINKTTFPVVFDSSKFDYSYTASDFESDTATDFENIIESEYGEVFNLYRQTTTEDGMGKVLTSVKTEHRLSGMIQDILAKDKTIHEMGLAVTGNKKVFLKPVYTETSAGTDSTFSVREGDVLFDKNEIRWRVEKILASRDLGGTDVFVVAIIKNLDLKGSA